jgi:hypothetical protein
MEVEATTLLKESQASPAVLAGLHIFDPLMEVEATTLLRESQASTTLLKESQASPAVLAGLHIFDPRMEVEATTLQVGMEGVVCVLLLRGALSLQVACSAPLAEQPAGSAEAD